ncbi:hypothetical protein RJ639_000660 [Escallonia herrerae]|uniref:Chaperone DnaJ-domain superfamily protein n=1 Tax=Escallonia herrerae TaxID=1293975 RepID=A0AA88X816_9ASTE|nr:hypothetical protein RJ639_000660 [Escallonia herrerae]
MAAASATTAATTYIYRREFRSPIIPQSCSNYVTFLAAKRRGFCIRSSEGDETVATEVETESPVEVIQGAPSLISALNVEKALRGIAITDADHYGRLGLQKGCSYDQVTIAYKNKIEELMSQGLDEGEVSQRLELLKESHSILSSVEDRRLYDWSLARNGNPDKYVWPFEVDITQIPTQTPPPPEPEDVEPTRLVGYFMLSWLILAFTLSIALNR